jgi:hypothetical protein
MTDKEAYKHAKYGTYTSLTDKAAYEFRVVAAQALEKRVKQTPSGVYVRRCPICRAKIERDWLKPPFCEQCGQALDWSDGE